jgi:hypothetical protein
MARPRQPHPPSARPAKNNCRNQTAAMSRLPPRRTASDRGARKARISPAIREDSRRHVEPSAAFRARSFTRRIKDFEREHCGRGRSEGGTADCARPDDQRSEPRRQLQIHRSRPRNNRAPTKAMRARRTGTSASGWEAVSALGGSVGGDFHAETYFDDNGCSPRHS